MVSFYDVLALLKTRADDPEAEAIQRAMRRLAGHYPGLVTEPLPPPKDSEGAEPALIEIVLLPPGTPEFRGYEARTTWHPAGGAAGRSGPCREGDIRLDLASGDSVAGFLGEVLDALGEWNLDGRLAVLLFRVPENLFLHPFDADWKHPDTELPIGYDYPVVVAPHWGQRHYPLRQQFGNRIAPLLEQPLRRGIEWATSAVWPNETADRGKLIDGMDRSACVAIEKVPDVRERKTLLNLLVARGVVIGLWPRHPDAEPGFHQTVESRLGDHRLLDLPLALRQLRHDGVLDPDPNPVWRHLTLLWDDPLHGRSLFRPGRFHAGIV